MSLSSKGDISRLVSKETAFLKKVLISKQGLFFFVIAAILSIPVTNTLINGAHSGLFFTSRIAESECRSDQKTKILKRQVKSDDKYTYFCDGGNNHNLRIAKKDNKGNVSISYTCTGQGTDGHSATYAHCEDLGSDVACTVVDVNACGPSPTPTKAPAPTPKIPPKGDCLNGSVVVSSHNGKCIQGDEHKYLGGTCGVLKCENIGSGSVCDAGDAITCPNNYTGIPGQSNGNPLGQTAQPPADTPIPAAPNNNDWCPWNKYYTDRYFGGDGYYDPEEAHNPSACEQACKNDDLCTAWTMSKKVDRCVFYKQAKTSQDLGISDPSLGNCSGFKSANLTSPQIAPNATQLLGNPVGPETNTPNNNQPGNSNQGGQFNGPFTGYATPLDCASDGTRTMRFSWTPGQSTTGQRAEVQWVNAKFAKDGPFLDVDSFVSFGPRDGGDTYVIWPGFQTGIDHTWRVTALYNDVWYGGGLGNVKHFTAPACGGGSSSPSNPTNPYNPPAEDNPPVVQPTQPTNNGGSSCAANEVSCGGKCWGVSAAQCGGSMSNYTCSNGVPVCSL